MHRSRALRAERTIKLEIYREACVTASHRRRARDPHRRPQRFLLASVLQALAPYAGSAAAQRGEHQNCAPVVCARIERCKQLPYRAALRHTQQTPRSSFTSRLQQTDCSTDHSMSATCTRRIGTLRLTKPAAASAQSRLRTKRTKTSDDDHPVYPTEHPPCG